MEFTQTDDGPLIVGTGKELTVTSTLSEYDGGDESSVIVTVNTVVTTGATVIDWVFG